MKRRKKAKQQEPKRVGLLFIMDTAHHGAENSQLAPWVLSSWAPPLPGCRAGRDSAPFIRPHHLTPLRWRPRLQNVHGGVHLSQSRHWSFPLITLARLFRDSRHWDVSSPRFLAARCGRKHAEENVEWRVTVGSRTIWKASALCLCPPPPAELRSARLFLHLFHWDPKRKQCRRRDLWYEDMGKCKDYKTKRLQEKRFASWSNT